MRIHHLNAASYRPPGGALVDGRSAAARARLACHCLLVEARDGLVLVDSGLGLEDVRRPAERLSAPFRRLLAPELREELTCVRQVERLGYEARDVRHVVLTHLDQDHAGGLDDFPWAAVHLLAAERDAALARCTALDRWRYRPAQWGSVARWHAYQAGEGESWMGLGCVRGLEGLPSDDVLLVPLVGHSRGHAGVAVRRDRGWLLHAGDAYLDRRELDPYAPRCPPGLRLLHRLAEADRAARRWNLERLRELAVARAGEVDVLSSHDPEEFERAAGRALERPVAPMLRPPPPELRRPEPGEEPRRPEEPPGASGLA